jgi:hypothetical protein
MTARMNRHIFNANLEPINDPDYHKFVDSVRAVVDTISCPEQEDLLNKHLSEGVKWGDDGVYVKNNDAIQIAYGPYIGGDCFLKSFECYWKLRSAGAKRFCGRRTAIAGLDTDEHPHYWVENNGMVFDCGGGQQKIYKKEKFYEQMAIRGEREGNEMGCFRADEYEVMLEDKTKYILFTYGLKALIKFVGDACKSDNVESLVKLKRGEQPRRTRFTGGAFYRC